MTSQVYSREYLQGIPELQKQETINQIIQSFIHQLQVVAASGKTSYLYEIPASCHIVRTPHIPGQVIPAQVLFSKHHHQMNVDITIPPTWQYQPTYPILNLDDVVQGLKKKFPDCKVSYEETWIENTSRQNAGQITKTLKKGILIDWS